MLVVKDVFKQQEAVSRCAPQALIMLLLLAGGTASAQKSYKIVGYVASLSVEATGAVHVREEIEFEFAGPFTYLFREISLDGMERIEWLGATDQSGAALAADVRESRGKFFVQWTFPEATGKRKFILEYRAHGVIVRSAGFDLLDWDVVGSGWTVTVRDIRVQVRVPGRFTAEEMTLQPRGVVHGAERRGGEGPLSTLVGFDYPALPRQTSFRIQVRYPARGTAPSSGLTPARGPRPEWLVAAGVLGAVAILVASVFVYRTRLRRLDDGRRKPVRRVLIVAGVLVELIGTAAAIAGALLGLPVSVLIGVLLGLCGSAALTLGAVTATGGKA